MKMKGFSNPPSWVICYQGVTSQKRYFETDILISLTFDLKPAKVENIFHGECHGWCDSIDLQLLCIISHRTWEVVSLVKEVFCFQSCDCKFLTRCQVLSSFLAVMQSFCSYCQARVPSAFLLFHVHITLKRHVSFFTLCMYSVGFPHHIHVLYPLLVLRTQWDGFQESQW